MGGGGEGVLGGVRWMILPRLDGCLNCDQYTSRGISSRTFLAQRRTVALAVEVQTRSRHEKIERVAAVSSVGSSRAASGTMIGEAQRNPKNLRRVMLSTLFLTYPHRSASLACRFGIIGAVRSARQASRKIGRTHL